MGKLTDDQRTDAVRRYRAHEPVISIAGSLGVSRMSIYKLLRSRGVKRTGTIRVVCPKCGERFSCYRNRVRRSRRTYCSAVCYFNHIRSPEYTAWRHGSRIARAKVVRLFDLEEQHVVHHVDGNQTNNEFSNLMVFANQGDHMRWHRLGSGGSGVVPLWVGRD